jgi:hypothetical protein
MEMNTWKRTYGNEHMEMDTWKWTHENGQMNMDTWTRIHEHMDKDTWTWTLQHGLFLLRAVLPRNDLVMMRKHQSTYSF